MKGKGSLRIDEPLPCFQPANAPSLLAQEQGERARLLGGMRDALAGLRHTGDVEGRLRGELLQAHQVGHPSCPHTAFCYALLGTFDQMSFPW